MRKVHTIPHPYLIEPRPSSETWDEGDELQFDLLLIGRAIDYFSYFVVAAQQMARGGLGARRAKFELLSVRDSQGAVLFSNDSSDLVAVEGTHFAATEAFGFGDTVTIKQETPLRLVEQGKLVTDLTFRRFLRALLGRLANLLYFHCDRALDIDFRALLARAEQVQATESTLAVTRLRRWSNRQKKSISLTGITGEIIWRGELVSELWPVLAAGELIHVGKGTVFGLGKYQIIAMEKRQS